MTSFKTKLVASAQYKIANYGRPSGYYGVLLMKDSASNTTAFITPSAYKSRDEAIKQANDVLQLEGTTEANRLQDFVDGRLLVTGLEPSIW
jgi:hypothetical protein